MNEPLKDYDLEQMRKRCEAATIGPWEAPIEGVDFNGGETVIIRGPNREGDDLNIIGGTVADYKFVAHAREDIPLLLDEIIRLRKIVDK